MLFLFFNNQETRWKTEETFKSFKDKKSLSKKKILIEQKQSSV